MAFGSCSSNSSSPSPPGSDGGGGSDGGADAKLGMDGTTPPESGMGDGAPGGEAGSCPVSTAEGGAPNDCGCSGNPGTLTSDSMGPCIRYAAPTGMLANTPACSLAGGCDIVYRFDTPYACGQFANGDYFVVPPAGGKVNVTAIEPAT